MMIATLILGFGLLMIGAVLPIAWQGSIRTTALSQADGAVEFARTLIQKSCLVDSNRDLFLNTASPSNQIYDPLYFSTDGTDFGDSVSYCLLGDGDTLDEILNIQIIGLVHALHMENWAVQAGSAFQYPATAGSTYDLRVAEAPGLIDKIPVDVNPIRLAGTPAVLDTSASGPPWDRVGRPIVPLTARVFPPLPADLVPTDNSGGVTQWQETLDSRYFAWGVLYKFTRQPSGPSDPRFLMMYYFTLRRGSSTNRFAREYDYDGNLEFSATGTPPLALGSVDDVAFPIAWRVPLLVLESQSPGVPAVAFAGANPNESGWNGAVLPVVNPPIDVTSLPVLDNDKLRVAEMFPAGTFFVDEQNGNLYRVMEREFLDIENHLARLTLDIPIRGSDINSNPGLDNDPDTLEIGQGSVRNRVVWVYPPAVTSNNRPNTGDPVIFSGPSPVADVKMEPLILLPQ